MIAAVTKYDSGQPKPTVFSNYALAAISKIVNFMQADEVIQCSVTINNFL
jgi:hypothetical protein